jgi:hypothetical protein
MTADRSSLLDTRFGSDAALDCAPAALSAAASNHVCGSDARRQAADTTVNVFGRRGGRS